MKTVTMLELRQNAEAVVQDLRRGQTLIPIHCAQPIARFEPILPAAEDIAADDPLYALAKQAGRADDDSKMTKTDTRQGLPRGVESEGCVHTGFDAAGIGA